jgi:hypothetical protein
VVYAANARLIDLSTKKVVAEGHRKRAPDSEIGALVYDELLANGAVLLKKEFAIATQSCITTLKAEMFVL